MSSPAAAPTLAHAGTVAWEPLRTRRLHGSWTAPAGVLVLLAAALISVARVDRDSGNDLLGLGRSIGADLLRLRWQYALVVVTLAALHYGATAVATRAASGVRVPIGEVLLVQLAAAAANRVTPGGLGGSAVNARYFTRRGLDVRAAIGAVAVLGVLGAVADLAVLVLLVAVGRRFGVSGASREIGQLAGKLSFVQSPWTWLAGGGVLVAGMAVRRRRSARGNGHAAMVWSPVRRLARNPSALGTLLGASALTTLILGFAFVASTDMVPGPRPVAGVGALLVAFMIGAAAGSAVPIPAGLGSTEAALVAVLVGVHLPAANAVRVVLIFRLLTFWLPAVAGVLATRTLRRRSAI